MYLEALHVVVDFDDAVEGTPADLAKWQAAITIRPEAVNDAGQISGYADGQAFVLTPSSE